MTEEEPDRLEALAKSADRDRALIGLSSRDAISLIALARVGLAVQPRPISEAPEDTACIIMGNQTGDIRELAHYNTMRKAWVANWDGRPTPVPTHFIPISALPKPGCTDKWLAAIDAAGDVEVGAGIMAALPKPGGE